MSRIAVVIAARNATATIASAVRSALEQPEVGRVLIVDDGSTDDTLGAARGADDGSGRLHPIRLDVNRGPAHARNIAIANAREEFVSILDADDFFLPGRMARLLAAGPFDMAADNIAFVREGSKPAADPLALRAAVESQFADDAPPSELTLPAFIEGNITRRGRPRGELGFLKPIIRRELLAGLEGPYDVSLRLGEDYDLYARLLCAGARFKVIRACGYAAIVRGNSLSGRHSAEDLRRFAGVDAQLAARPGLDRQARRMALRHGAQSLARFEHRRFLQEKSERGLLAAAGALARRPAAWRAVVTGVGADKLGSVMRSPPSPDIRFLFPPVHGTTRTNHSHAPLLRGAAKIPEGSSS
ncbi:glycosyltransferase family 2 protein [Aureimonas populi]|uniref:Glycosyltransferase family 2 protein n=1 Tax=Aureimonas populi TaxID=1701758 RepID=A0ABW5CQC1_9HYPH|nr:glycosyltransferase family 2 protein [Aureimonas populi]